MTAMRTRFLILYLICFPLDSIRLKKKRTVTPPFASTQDPERLVGIEQMQRWKAWRNRRTVWEKFKESVAWSVLDHADQRKAIDLEFQFIFSRLIQDNIDILDSPQVLMCHRIASTDIKRTPRKLALRSIELECTHPVNVFDLEAAWPTWKKELPVTVNFWYNTTDAVTRKTGEAMEWMSHHTVEQVGDMVGKFATMANYSWKAVGQMIRESCTPNLEDFPEANFTNGIGTNENVTNENGHHRRHHRKHTHEDQAKATKPPDPSSDVPALQKQKISFVITDIRNYPYRLGARDGVGGESYDDEYVICIGGRLRNSISDPTLPPDALAKRCTGFLGGREISNMIDSVISSLQPGKGQKLETVKADIRCMAQWLILAGFNGQTDDFNSKEIAETMIGKANKVGIGNMLKSWNWHALGDVGKMFASSWLDHLEGRNFFLPMDELVDLGVIDVATLTNLLLPLGSMSNSQGIETEGEKQWEEMTDEKRKKVIQELEAEHHELSEISQTLEGISTAISAEEQKEKANIANVSIDRLWKLVRMQCEKRQWPPECVPYKDKFPDLANEPKQLAKDVAKLAAKETALAAVLSEGARVIGSAKTIHLPTETLYNHTQVITQTRPVFGALQGFHHFIDNTVVSAGKFFCPKLTERYSAKMQAMAEHLGRERHQDFVRAHDMLAGPATLKPDVSFHATEHLDGLADFVKSGNPDHLEAAIKLTGDIGVQEDDGLSSAIEGITQGSANAVHFMNNAVQHAEAHPLAHAFMNGVQRGLVHIGSKSSDTAGHLADHFKAFRHPASSADWTHYLPDTMKRNFFFESDEALKQHIQERLDNMNQNINWTHADSQLLQEIEKALHGVKSVVHDLHPHADVQIKYDVVVNKKIENGQLVLHEIAKLHPELTVHGGFLAGFETVNPLTYIAAVTPFLHMVWMVYRLGTMFVNWNWHLQMADIVNKWNQGFRALQGGTCQGFAGRGDIPTACVCPEQDGRQLSPWPAEACARNPDASNSKRQKEVPGEGTQKFHNSSLEGKMYPCSEICTAVAGARDKGDDTWIDEELKKNEKVDPAHNGRRKDVERHLW